MAREPRRGDIRVYSEGSPADRSGIWAWSGTEWVALRGISGIDLTVRAGDFDELKLVVHPFNVEFYTPAEHVRFAEYGSVTDAPPPLIDKSDMQAAYDARLFGIEQDYHTSLARVLQSQATGLSAAEAVEQIRRLGVLRENELQAARDG